MKNKRIIIVMILAIMIVSVLAVTGLYWMNQTVTQAGLEALEYDPGNIPDDSWTARY